MNSKTNMPPPPADPELVQKIALLSPIGQCLQESLQDMIQESLVRELQEADQHDEKAAPSIDSDIADRILDSFGKAVSDTDWHREFKGIAPPAALLRGRIDYYNRVEGRWEIMVDNAELRPRALLDPNRKKRTRERPSLWDVSLRQEKRRPTTTLEGKLQVLVYDDL